MDEEDRQGDTHPSDSFDPNLYQQPALSKRWLDPEPYRTEDATEDAGARGRRRREVARRNGAGDGSTGGEKQAEGERRVIEMRGVDYGSAGQGGGVVGVTKLHVQESE